MGGRRRGGEWCSRLRLRRGRGLNGGVLAAGAREPPGEESGARRKRSQGEHPRSEREPAASNPYRSGRVELLLGGEAGVVLVDEALRVEVEVVRIGAEEPFRVGSARQDVEAFVLERPEVLGANPRIALDIRELELPTRPRLAKAAADLEQLLRLRVRLTRGRRHRRPDWRGAERGSVADDPSAPPTGWLP